jgi:beta-lactam-binding protein with PASTA domain
VAQQDPAGGTSSQGAVTIVVHGTDGQVTVPNVVGLGPADAQASLAAAGLGAALPSGSSGTAVTGQSPAAGTSVEIGSVVQLAVDGQAASPLIP